MIIQDWIPVDERLPDSQRYVLIAGKEFVGLGWYYEVDKTWNSHEKILQLCFEEGKSDVKVTHWTEIPDRPNTLS